MKYFLLFVFFLGHHLNAQNVESSQTSSAKNIKDKIEFFFDMGWFVPPSIPNAKLDYIISVDYTPGIRLELVNKKSFMLITEASYHNVHYHLHQDENKRLPSSRLYDRERFYVHVINVGLLLGLNIPKTSLSFHAGLNLDYNFRTVHMIKDPDVNGKLVKVYNPGITYFENFNSDILFRLKLKKWSLHYSYRLSPLISPESDLPSLNKTVIGIGLSFKWSDFTKDDK